MKRAWLAPAAVPVAGAFSFGTAYALDRALQRLFPPEALGPSAAEGLFAGRYDALQVALIAVVAAPLYETLLAQVVPLEIARRLHFPWAWGLAASAAVFGLAHWLGGGVGHGVVTLCMGAVFAGMYLAFRRDGPWVAYGAAAGTHAVHNGLALWLVH